MLNKPLLDVVEFGCQLIDTQDLDPIYTMLYKAEMEPTLLKRWLLAYFCFYHAGVASKIAESKDWHREAWKAHLEKWPRGRERRHFRGITSSNALSFLKAYYPEPEKSIDNLCEAVTFRGVSNKITKWPYFGPWIAFKAADIIDRVIGKPIKFSIDDLGFYEEPAAAAELISPGKSLRDVVNQLVVSYSDRKAPPRMDRPIGINEVETCMCKYKSYCGGHYYVGQDTKEIGHALQNWGLLAIKLSKFLPVL